MRRSNDVAVEMYRKFGYEIYRTVLKVNIINWIFVCDLNFFDFF